MALFLVFDFIYFLTAKPLYQTHSLEASTILKWQIFEINNAVFFFVAVRANGLQFRWINKDVSENIIDDIFPLDPIQVVHVHFLLFPLGLRLLHPAELTRITITLKRGCPFSAS
jgi:hypothetical protein